MSARSISAGVVKRPTTMSCFEPDRRGRRDRGCKLCGACDAVWPPRRCLKSDRPAQLGQAVPTAGIEFTVANVIAVPEAAGVYQLLDAGGTVLAIKGVASLRQGLAAMLDQAAGVSCFVFEEAPLFSQRENQIIEAHLQRNGQMPPGVAGDEMDDCIVQYFRRKHNLVIGETTAEEVKIQIGSVFPLKEEKTIEVKGRDQAKGLPKTILVTSEEIRQALMEPVQLIVDVIKQVLEETPPELSSDLVDRGMVLAGGGSLLRGFPELIRQETELPVHRAADPLSCVALGCGKYLEELDRIQQRPEFLKPYR